MTCRVAAILEITIDIFERPLNVTALPLIGSFHTARPARPPLRKTPTALSAPFSKFRDEKNSEMQFGFFLHSLNSWTSLGFTGKRFGNLKTRI